ncbi:MAG: response regulator [Betaproteobacteria bacterium]|nr:response regulator [Betaproteobacteria bacterium]
MLMLDMLMPELDGPAAARQIRQELGLADLPIVCMSANPFQDDHQRCLDAGMNTIIDKPFQPDRVIAALSAYLRPAAPGPTDSGA